MISIIRFAATMCLGENAPISRCLRNRTVIHISQALQGVMTLASTVTAIACFYVGFDDPTSDREILFTTGGFSLALTVISCCGNLYICDFKRIIDEGKLKKAVGEAGRDIAIEAGHVRRDVRSFAEAQLAITHSVNSLEEHVKIAGKKIDELDGEFHSAKETHEATRHAHDEIRIDIERLQEQSGSLERATHAASAIHRESMETRTDAIRRLEALEKRIAEEEKEAVRGFEGTALTVAKAARFERIERVVLQLAESDPHSYREITRRVPELRFV
jgi:hypothetical protein